MKSRQTRREFASGFTLVEMAMSTAILTVVMAGTLSLFITFLRSYNATTLMRNTSSRTSLALERMVYGVGTNAGLREAEAASVITNYSSGGWQISYINNSSSKYFQYTTNTMKIADQDGKTICTNVINSTLTARGTNGCLIGCRILVSTSESAGGRTFTNSMTSFAKFRN